MGKRMSWYIPPPEIVEYGPNAWWYNPGVNRETCCGPSVQPFERANPQPGNILYRTFMADQLPRSPPCGSENCCPHGQCAFCGNGFCGYHTTRGVEICLQGKPRK